MSKYTNANLKNELDEIDDIEILDFPEINVKPLFNVEHNTKEKVIKQKEEKQSNIEIIQESKNKTIEEKEKNNKKTNKSKYKKIKNSKVQNIFIISSIIFILGCCIFYGSRLIKYYKIYNPTTSTGEKLQRLSKKIISRPIEIDDKTSGLYNSNGYIFKGDVNDNYLKFNNLLWRIVTVNYDGSIQIILDDYYNYLQWNKEIDSFDNSDLYDFLNTEFLNKLDVNQLIKQKICLDEINEINKFTCNDSIENYVSLLNSNMFLSTIINDNTYLSNDESMWLSTKSNSKIYSTNSSYISENNPSTFLQIRPTIILTNELVYTTGDGTKENPYIVSSSKELEYGKILKLDNDEYYIADINKDNIILLSKKTIQEKRKYDITSSIFNEDNYLYKYLNNEYLDTLSYKNLIIENDYPIGKYINSYKDVNTNKIKAKIAIPSLKDSKIDNNVNNYFLTTYVNDGYILNDELYTSRIELEKNIRILITIKNSINIIGGEGTLESPYIVEVK